MKFDEELLHGNKIDRNLFKRAEECGRTQWKSCMHTNTFTQRFASIIYCGTIYANSYNPI